MSFVSKHPSLFFSYEINPDLEYQKHIEVIERELVKRFTTGQALKLLTWIQLRYKL